MVRVCCHLCVCGSRKFSAMLAVWGEAGAGLSVPGQSGGSGLWAP